jgi:TonB family protein
LDRPFDWMKYVLAALVVHAAVLCVPVAHKATQAVKERVIDIVVMRQEPSPPPVVEKKAIIPKPEPAKARIPAQVNTLPEKAPEKKEVPKPSGGGNVLDETIVSQVAPGPATGGSDGVGIAGANVAGGKIGLGGGGTGAGTGTGTGSGSGAAPASGPTGPVDMRFGEPGGPQFLVRESPEYPPIAVKMRRDGRAVIRVTIDDKGKLTKAEILDATDQFFGQAALQAAKDSKYLAAKRNGTPYATRTDIAYKFSMSK